MIHEQDGITFNNVKEQSDSTVNMGQWPIVLAGQQGPDEDGGITNAVDIDWNDADFISAPAENPVTISTSGDLIKAIKWASTVGSGDNGAVTSVNNKNW